MPATPPPAPGVCQVPEEGRRRLPRPGAARRLRQLLHPQARRGQSLLAKNPRVTLHFTPTGCSWINLVECFFSVITRQAIRRGSFTSVKELTAVIGVFIDQWNEHPRPFAWTKDADEILASIKRAKAKANVLTDH